MSWFTWVIEPLSFPFMQHALITALAVGLVCAVLSCYLVLKGWALMGDAISHAVLPGIVIAYVIGAPLFIGAFVSGLGCALLTGFIKQHSRIKEDSVMGIVFAGMFAFGLLLFAKVETDQHLNHILFGDLMGIRPQDQFQALLIAALVVLVFIFKWRDFLLYCFDASHARVAALPVSVLHYGLLSMLALTIVASIQAVGVIMVIAMLVAPGITAFILTKQFSKMLFIAITVSLVSCFFGVLISFYVDGATSACIVLLQSLIFCVVLIAKRIALMLDLKELYKRSV